MDVYCSICLKEETVSDIAENNWFTDVEDKTYCVKCYNDIKTVLICCDRCLKEEHKNENFHDQYVETRDIDGDVIYYHVKCLFKYELCPICKTYSKNKEWVDILIDYDSQIKYHKSNPNPIKYHKSCVENEDNIWKYDICRYCGVSLLVKCEDCEHRFRDCYNKDCKNYSYYEHDYIDRYDGRCEKCLW